MVCVWYDELLETYGGVIGTMVFMILALPLWITDLLVGLPAPPLESSDEAEAE